MPRQIDLADIQDLASTSPNLYGGDRTLSAETECLLMTLLEYAHQKWLWCNNDGRISDAEWNTIEDMLGLAEDEIQYEPI